jgi:multiple sugar transport system substrate-binding protein
MFWGTQDQIDATLAAINTFTASNSLITAQPQYSAYEGYFDKLATRVAGGNPPDIFQIDLPYLADYASRGTLLEVSQFAQQLGLNQLPDALQTLSKYDGVSYFTLVGGITQPGMAYNVDLLTQLGLDAPVMDWTLDDFEKIVTAVVTASGGDVYGTNDFGAAVVAIESFMVGRGKALYSEDGGLGFSESDLAAWLSFWKRLRDSKAAPPMSYTAAQAGFKDYPIVKGESVFSQVPTARGVPALQALTKAQLVMHTYPSVEKGGVLGTTIVPVEIWAISA